MHTRTRVLHTYLENEFALFTLPFLQLGRLLASEIPLPAFGFFMTVFPFELDVSFTALW